MHRLAYGVLGAALAVLTAAPAMATHISLNGNGLPHINYSESFRLNLHAYNNCPAGDFEDSSRHTIALLADFGPFGVPGAHPDLLKTNDILLTSGADFHVIDGNACDADPAKFQLPLDVSTGDWEVYFRLVGQPGTGLDIATCGTDTTNTIICGGALVRIRGSGQGSKPHFEDVTRQLLTVNGTPLFTSLTGEFWEAFTQGQAKAQLVFVPAP